jgi:hypothetical protein
VPNRQVQLPTPPRSAPKRWFGFRTGDLVKVVVPSGKYAGTHTGRVTIQSRPNFRLNGIDIHPKYIKRIGHADGYAYSARTPEGTAPILCADAVRTAVLPFPRTPNEI